MSARNRSRRVLRFLLDYSALAKLVCFMTAIVAGQSHYHHRELPE